MNPIRILITVDDLGPALFNRFGGATSGNHCIKLVTDWNKKRGFANFKYKEIWVHRPNPKDPYEVAKHAMQMEINDANLPKTLWKILSGVFRGCHLTHVIKLAKEERHKYADSEEIITPASGNAEFQFACEHGLYAFVFDYEDVEKHMPLFMALMAADNMDSDINMPEDEISVLRRAKRSLAIVDVGVQDRDNQVVGEVMALCSGRWKEEEVGALVDFAKTTSKDVIAFLEVFQRFYCDPQVFFVEPAYFGYISPKCPDSQWLARGALTVMQYMSDRDPKKKEVLALGNGKLRADSVSNAMMDNITKMPKKDRSVLEDLLTRIMRTYWNERLHTKKCTTLILELGYFLKKMGKWLPSTRLAHR